MWGGSGLICCDWTKYQVDLTKEIVHSVSLMELEMKAALQKLSKETGESSETTGNYMVHHTCGLHLLSSQSHASLALLDEIY